MLAIPQAWEYIYYVFIGINILYIIYKYNV